MSVQDRPGARMVLGSIRARYPLLGLVWVDGSYVNTVDTSVVGWAAATEGIEIVAVPRHADVKGFQVLPAGGWSNARFLVDEVQTIGP
ncbi:hypothetical protein [Nocardia speluncae]|uniref:hypothetical protein n=1 Tax=Nocardia speluncae TaxID=419477 RepID=UPI001B3496BA|nr:hypothetical protein [Nocardia speluncae]